MRVGLFDSGIGGLTVLKSMLKYHPNNEYFYYGDTLNMPYGDKTIDELYKCVKNIIDYFYEKKVDLIIIACGTVSANLYDRLKNEVKIPIYSVINNIPSYINQKDFKKTLVLATTNTINSHFFKNNIKNEVIEVACPKLVPLIEEKKYDEIKIALNDYLQDLDNVDSIVLGCTHYPFIKKLIKDRVSENVEIIDLGEIFSKNINLVDSKKEINLYFSKKIDDNNEIIQNIVK